MNLPQPAMDRYWLIWFMLWFTTFIVPETWALATGHPERTLSAAIWRIEQLIPGQNQYPWQWTAGHFLFTGSFLVVAVWLGGHFGWGIWR
jgi:hypothetical protein